MIRPSTKIVIEIDSHTFGLRSHCDGRAWHRRQIDPTAQPSWHGLSWEKRMVWLLHEREELFDDRRFRISTRVVIEPVDHPWVKAVIDYEV
jgi:hypothetical protein